MWSMRSFVHCLLNPRTSVVPQAGKPLSTTEKSFKKGCPKSSLSKGKRTRYVYCPTASLTLSESQELTSRRQRGSKPSTELLQKKSTSSTITTKPERKARKKSRPASVLTSV